MLNFNEVVDEVVKNGEPTEEQMKYIMSGVKESVNMLYRGLINCINSNDKKGYSKIIEDFYRVELEANALGKIILDGMNASSVYQEMRVITEKNILNIRDILKEIGIKESKDSATENFIAVVETIFQEIKTCIEKHDRENLIRMSSGLAETFISKELNLLVKRGMGRDSANEMAREFVNRFIQGINKDTPLEMATYTELLENNKALRNTIDNLLDEVKDENNQDSKEGRQIP